MSTLSLFRSVWILSKNIFQRVFFEKSVLIGMILLPIVLIGLLGTSLSGLSKPLVVEPFSVGVVFSGIPEEAQNRLTFFFEQAQVKKQFSYKLYDSQDSAIDAMEQSKEFAVIKVAVDPQLVGKSAIPLKLTTYYKERGTVRQTIVSVTVTTLVDSMKVMNTLAEKFNNSNITPFDFKTHSSVKALAGNKSINAMDYYGVTMVVLVLFYGLSFSSSNIRNDFNGKLGVRMRVAPLSEGSMALSFFLTSTIVSFLQSAIVVTVAHLAFNVAYGQNMVVVLGVLLLGAAFFSVFGLLLGLAIRNENILQTVLNVGIPVMIFVGGGYYNINLGIVNFLSPGKFVQDLMFGYMFTDSIRWDIVISFATITLVCFIVVTSKIRNHRGESNACSV